MSSRIGMAIAVLSRVPFGLGVVNVEAHCHRSRHCGVSHTPFPSDSPSTLTLADALASDATLQLSAWACVAL
jgi:hypothetical protein